MIASLSGRITHKSADSIILDVSGVGYEVQVSLNTLEKLPEEGSDTTLQIFTYVREDNLSLFGFLTSYEKRVFTRLIKISGIGPKLALSILSGLPPSDLVAAVTSEDLARLNAIPGVGRKTAERIIVDLKDKLVKDQLLRPVSDSGSSTSNTYDDALSALMNLGYPKTVAERALGRIGAGKKAPLPSIIKEALKELASL